MDWLRIKSAIQAIGFSTAVWYSWFSYYYFTEDPYQIFGGLLVGIIIGYWTISKRDVGNWTYSAILGTSQALALIGPSLASLYEMEHVRSRCMGISIAFTEGIVMGVCSWIARCKLPDSPN